MLLLAGASPAQQPQEGETPVFRSDVALVRVDVQVLGKNGRVLSGFAKADFRVLDEGTPQPIAYFGRESDPLDVLLLLDVSGSMRRSLEEMAASAASALKALLPKDQAGVILFARRTELRQELTSQFSAIQTGIRQAMDEQKLGAGSLINPALLAAAELMEKQPVRGRRAVLILTDNEGLQYQSPDDAVIAKFFAADTVLNALVVRNKKPAEPRRIVNPDFTPPNVFGIAEATGGEAVAAKAGETFGPMLERMRTRYSLQYAAPQGTPGSFRRIQVELTAEALKRNPDARVRARKGYFVKP